MFFDLFSLTGAGLLTLTTPRPGTSNVTKIMAQINSVRGLPFVRIVTALGIRGGGRAMSHRIAARFGTVAAIRSATVEQMAETAVSGSLYYRQRRRQTTPIWSS
jgi:DNA ligase (NAD+)